MNEHTIKHAYLIMAHADVEQLNLLLKALDSDYSDIYLHIDAKSSIKLTEIVKLKKSKLILCDSMNVYWADYSQVECELSLLKQATKKNYCYYHLISGSDFPIMTPKEIYEFLKEKNDLFIHYTTSERLYTNIGYVKYYHWFQKKLHIVNRDKTFSIFKVINKVLLLLQRILKVNRVAGNINIKKGANWFSIPDDFAKYVLKQEKFIQNQFSNTRSPDEFFMQTLAYNSDFRSRIYCFKENDSYESCLRYIDWERGTPYVFKAIDFADITHSSMLFARKFDIKLDKNIIYQLYEWLSNKSNSENIHNVR